MGDNGSAHSREQSQCKKRDFGFVSTLPIVQFVDVNDFATNETKYSGSSVRVSFIYVFECEYWRTRAGMEIH